MSLSFSTYQSAVDVAIASVREAATLCGHVQDSLDPHQVNKADKSPVTLADLGSQALICRSIRQAFPDDSIVAEETTAELTATGNEELRERLVAFVRSVREGADLDLIREWIGYGSADPSPQRFWTLDPVDGTKGFLRGDQYAVALALIEDGEVRLGVLACPRLDLYPSEGSGSLFVALAGEGAFVAALAPEAAFHQIHVSEISDPQAVRFCESFEGAHSSHGDAARVADVLGIQRPPLRLDSQAKYGLVAHGDAEFYLRVPRDDVYREKIWDHAAGVTVVQEAGGRVSDLDGKPLDFTRGRTLQANRGVLVSNTSLHEDVLAALQSG